MWLSLRRQLRRRRDGRKGPQGGGSRHGRSWPTGAPAVIGLVALLLGLVMAMDLLPPVPVTYRLGQYIPADIHARVEFQYPSIKLLADAKRQVDSTVPHTFKLNDELVDELVTGIRQLPERIKAVSAIPSTHPASAPQTQPASAPTTAPTSQPTPGELFDRLDKALRTSFDLSPADLQAWEEKATAANRIELDAHLDQLRQKLAGLYIVHPDKIINQRGNRKAVEVDLATGQTVARMKLDVLMGFNDPSVGDKILPELAQIFDSDIRRNVLAWLKSRILKSDGLYQYDEQATTRTINRALADLESDPPKETFNAGQIIVRSSASRTAGGAGEGLGEAGLYLLRAENQAYVQHLQSSAPLRMWGLVAGRALVLALFFAAMCAYVVRYRPQLAGDVWHALAVMLVIGLMLAVNKAIYSLLPWVPPYAAVLPVLLAATILAIAYDQRFALAIGTAVAALATLQIRSDLSMLVVLLAGVTICVLALDDIRSRSKTIQIFIPTALVCFTAVCAVDLVEMTPWRFTLVEGMWAGGMALLAGLVIQGTLPLVERMFGIATSMTLLEWGDSSKPLLRRLATETPGTYNHSLQLGIMCEAAAETVGARGLLVRVGAYYHDIGKINKPDYFVENQAGSPSRHSKLSPAMSLLVITGHVKDGLALAEEYGLPPVLHEFIATHHGTTLVQYFYRAAAEQRKSESDRAPDEVEFRYPGPKPRTKEAAILMLADAAESSVRALSDPSPGRIENQVHAMVTRRLMDGQLDECELTLREVHLIEMSLIRSLCAMHHVRVAYPTPAGQKPSAAEIKRAPDAPKPAPANVQSTPPDNRPAPPQSGSAGSTPS